MRARVAAVAVLLVAGPMLPGAAALSPTPAASPQSVAISGVYPNPVADGDAGEYVVLSVPTDQPLGPLELSDGERTVPLPNVTASGRIVLTENATALPPDATGRAVELRSWTALANSGERLRLRRGNRTLDTLAYEDAPEGELAQRTDDGIVWRPLGATDFEPVSGGSTTVRAFALPDAPGVPLRTLRTADRRVLLAGYTLSSERVTEALIAARRRGVAVSVLVDGGPVGGLTNRSAALLDRLAAANVSLRVADGPRAPYRFHHAKYAVVDSRAVVLTENWKPAGTGGNSSRGWGVVVNDSAVVSGLAETFRADTRERQTVPWRGFRVNETFESATPSNGTFPERFEPRRLRAEGVDLLVAPDNAADGVARLIANASDSVRVVQVSVGGPDNRLLRESVAAARRGVAVELLLSKAWYTAEDNRALAANLSAMAAREDLPLSVRLAEPNGRFEKIHAKGVVVDGEHAVVGSLNWNANAFENNREVALVLHGEAVAGYYGRVFDADWQGGVWTLTVGVLAVLVVVVGAAGIVGRRIEFRG